MIHIDHLASIIRRVPVSEPVSLVPGNVENVAVGDVVAARVESLGQHRFIENTVFREEPLQPGHVCLLALGNRYASMELCGCCPDSLARGDFLDMLNTGGVVGMCSTSHLESRDPTRLSYLGHVLAQDGNRLSTLDHGIPQRHPGADCQVPVEVLMVVGSNMDVGKTTTAAACVKAFTGLGIRACGCKLTGTGRMKDLLQMRRNGAPVVFDFLDFGFPSTHCLDARRLEGMFFAMLAQCMEHSCTVMVVEVADSIFQAESSLILGNANIMDRVSMLGFAASDALAAFGGCSLLQEMGRPVSFLSGLASAGPALMAETAAACARFGVPVISCDDAASFQDICSSLLAN